MIFDNKKSTIDDVIEIMTRGPWKTKSEANLYVLFSFSYNSALKYLEYDEKELLEIPDDIRGLRSYIIDNLKKDSVGGLEFHKIRKELFYVIKGTVELNLEDMNGNKKTLTLDAPRGIYIPPYIMHTYKIKEDDSIILCVANTLFNPEDRRTHDTYSKEDFDQLKKINK